MGAPSPLINHVGAHLSGLKGMGALPWIWIMIGKC
jgi:hypothetical protein